MVKSKRDTLMSALRVIFTLFEGFELKNMVYSNVSFFNFRMQ